MGTDQHLVQKDGDSKDDSQEEDSPPCSWKCLPTDPLVQIFTLLNYSDLARCGQVCQRWNEISNLNFIWQNRFRVDFNIDPEVPILESASSWKSEYQRITYLAPSIEFERISEHTDEVLHVSFSNDGMRFCTCSKDATVKVFNADWPFNTIFNEYLGLHSQFRWVYTQFSQFSKSDTQLLVSGRCVGSEQGGEIIIYNIFADQFTLQARVRIMPYDVMGTWLNETHILSARAHPITSQRKCLCEVLLNTSSQEVEDLHHSTVTRAFMFACENFNTVSYLHVADLTRVIAHVHRSVHLGCFEGNLHEMHVKALLEHKQAAKQNRKENTSQGSETPCTSTVTSISIKVGKASDTSLRRSSVDRTTNEIKKLKLEDCKGGPLGTIDTLQALPPNIKCCMAEIDNDSDSSNLFSGTASPQLTDDELDKDGSESTEATGDEGARCLKSPSMYKLLICFTGSNVDVPHQIGMKVITKEECTEVVRPEFDLAKVRRYSFPSGLADRPELKTDSWDHVIEMSGQVVGMAMSPCNRYLFVNVRKWASDIDPHNPRQAPPISSSVTMQMFDLMSMEEMRRFTNHKALSDVFFLHISCNNYYVGSGSEDKQGYLWDRHYGIPISTFRHENVVNGVATNPRDPSMAVSVSDDNLIKIWRSKSFHRLLNGARAKARMKPGI